MGGCSTPISALCEIADGTVFLRGNVVTPDGKKKLKWKGCTWQKLLTLVYVRKRNFTAQWPINSWTHPKKRINRWWWSYEFEHKKNFAVYATWNSGRTGIEVVEQEVYPGTTHSYQRKMGWIFSPEKRIRRFQFSSNAVTALKKYINTPSVSLPHCRRFFCLGKTKELLVEDRRSLRHHWSNSTWCR